MAKKTNYRIEKINGVSYELRPVEVDKKPVGLVPVPNLVPTPDANDLALSVLTIIADHQCGLTAETFCRAFRNGFAIMQQAKARNALDTDGVPETMIADEVNSIDDDQLTDYQLRFPKNSERFAAIRADAIVRCREKLAAGKLAIPADKIWLELL